MRTSLTALLESLNNPSLPGIDLSLDRVLALLTALDHPEKKLPPVIHVAGTNGKGSTIAFLRAMYEAAGYRVHVYTSPHLVRFNERIVLAGHEISDASLIPYLERVVVLAKKIPVTFFEASTVAAFLAFASHKADVLLLETGMGGRLDATNIVEKPLASVITPIGLDHQEYLGATLSAIAGEKAGIIKPGVPVFLAPQPSQALHVFVEKAASCSAPLIAYDSGWTMAESKQSLHVTHAGVPSPLPLPALAGAHQHANAALAAVVALGLRHALPLSLEAIQQGVLNACWKGRLQQLQSGPLCDIWPGEVWLDGGHNAHAARVLADWIAQHNEPVSMIVGMMQRKDAKAFFDAFAALPIPIVTIPIPGQADSYTPDILAKAAKASGCADVSMARSLTQAADQLRHRKKGVLLVTGSLFLAGEVLKTHA